MTRDLLDNSIIMEELGLSPIWLSASKKEVVKKELASDDLRFYLKKIVLQNINYLLIAPIYNSSNENELNLFIRICSYLDTLSNNSDQLNDIKQIKQSEVELKIKSANSLIFLEQGIERQFDKKELIIPYIVSISLYEMIKNPEKKRKLWQDIKDLLESINQ
ncbi:MAG: hypothetical protein CMH24_02320 [Nitrosomonadales bacterium]|nr:hypothetical protein [Nitrosomonadales bacterium]